MKRLLHHAKPGRLGIIPLDQWSHIETIHGELPFEYKAIIASLGFGSFGAITLFHPFSTYRLTNLEEARQFEWEILCLSYPDGARFLESPARLFGAGPERHVLAYMDGWWHLDYEMQETASLGPSLSDFLIEEYSAAIARPDGGRIGNSIWSKGEEEPSAFFSPATNPENIRTE